MSIYNIFIYAYIHMSKKSEDGESQPSRAAQNQVCPLKAFPAFLSPQGEKPCRGFVFQHPFLDPQNAHVIQEHRTGGNQLKCAPGKPWPFPLAFPAAFPSKQREKNGLTGAFLPAFPTGKSGRIIPLMD